MRKTLTVSFALCCVLVTCLATEISSSAHDPSKLIGFVGQYLFFDEPTDRLFQALDRKDAAGKREPDIDAVKRALADGASPDTTDASGQTAFAFAASAGETEVVKIMLKHNPRPNIEVRWHPRESGFTPLFFAAAAGHTDTVIALINAGAQVDGLAVDDTPPLVYALRAGHTEVVSVLLDHGANPTRLYQRKLRPLDELYLCPEEARGEIKLLLEKAILRSATTTVHVTLPVQTPKPTPTPKPNLQRKRSVAMAGCGMASTDPIIEITDGTVGRIVAQGSGRGYRITALYRQRPFEPNTQIYFEFTGPNTKVIPPGKYIHSVLGAVPCPPGSMERFSSTLEYY